MRNGEKEKGGWVSRAGLMLVRYIFVYRERENEEDDDDDDYGRWWPRFLNLLFGLQLQIDPIFTAFSDFILYAHKKFYLISIFFIYFFILYVFKS